MSRLGRRLLPGLALLAVLPTAGCAGGAASGGDAVVVLSVPASTQPWVARSIERGAELARREVAARGGVSWGGRRHRLVVQVQDDAGSPGRALAIARSAADHGAAAVLTDGTGAADLPGTAAPPVFVLFEGAAKAVDPARRPYVFRLAPADRPLATRLADYLAGHHPRPAVLTDDSDLGRGGRDALRAALARDGIPLRADVVVPQGAPVAPAVLRARAAGADTLLVWAQAATVAEAVRAARGGGWTAPVLTGPTGEDPLVRQRLADHPDWVEGLRFVSFRVTSETGPAPFAAFRRAYVAAFGEERLGVGGIAVPPDWPMLGYDAVRLLAAALARAGGPGAGLVPALESTVVTGANGDERGYGPGDREGVVPDDMYVARFHDLRYVPVTDDPLSATLPTVPQ